MKLEIDEVKKENRKLKEKNIVMKSLLLEFDAQQIDSKCEEDVIQ